MKAAGVCDSTEREQGDDRPGMLRAFEEASKMNPSEIRIVQTHAVCPDIGRRRLKSSPAGPLETQAEAGGCDGRPSW